MKNTIFFAFVFFFSTIHFISKFSLYSHLKLFLGCEDVHPSFNINIKEHQYHQAKEIHESINHVHDNIFSPEFYEMRSSIESQIEDLDHYRYMSHPQMASMHHRQQDSAHSYRASYYQSNRYQNAQNGNSQFNRQHRPQPNYPHVYSKGGNSFHEGRHGHGVSDEDIYKRIPKNKEKRVLFESDSLNDKKNDIKENHKYVFFGIEQPLITHWMGHIQRIFHDSEKKKNNYDIFLKLEMEFDSIGIRIRKIDEEELKNSTFVFDIFEYTKEIDSEYVPPLKMFVPYLTIN